MKRNDRRQEHEYYPRRDGPGAWFWIKLVLALSLIAGCGAAGYALVKSLDPGTLRFILGFILAMGSVLVVGVLYAGKDLVQGLVLRRREQEGEMHDTQRLAHWTRLMSGSASNRVQFTMPGMSDIPALMPPAEFTGAYRDTTLVNGKVEIE